MRFGTGSFLKTIAVSSTAEPLKAASAPNSAQEMILQADSGNAGAVYIGGSDVTNLIGLSMAAGDKIVLGNVFSAAMKNDLSFENIYVLGPSGAKIRVLYVNEANVAP